MEEEYKEKQFENQRNVSYDKYYFNFPEEAVMFVYLS